MSGDFVNKQLREPLIVTGNLIQFRINHQDETVSLQESLNTYDRNYGQVKALADFDGEWVECTLIYAQPVFCKMTDQ